MLDADRHKYKGQGPVKYNDVSNRIIIFSYSLFKDDELRAVADGQCPWAFNMCVCVRERTKENRRR